MERGVEAKNVAPDPGLWVTWYDLPEDGRDDYLAWLHDQYIPKVLGRSGVLWGAHYAEVPQELRPKSKRETGTLKRTQDTAVPNGSKYILVFGAYCADVFGNPVPSSFNASLDERDRTFLSMRIAPRVSVMSESGRVNGPEASGYPDGMLLAPCIQFGTYNIDWQHEEDMLALYVEKRLPTMGNMAGCVRTRKLSGVSGWAKHGVLYEFVSLEARNTHFFGHEEVDPATKARFDQLVARLTHAPGSANLATRIWSAPGKDLT